MSHASYRNLLGDRGRFMGEEGILPAEALSITDAYQPTPEEQAQWETEARELEACYANEAEAERLASLALYEPDKALVFLIDCHGGDDDIPAPVRVVEVFEAYAGNSTSIDARVQCNDGHVHRVKAYYSYYSGSWDSPPDADVGYEDYLDEEYQ